MRLKRTKKEIAALERLCAKVIFSGPMLRGPDPTETITVIEAARRAKLLVSHCLDKPVSENG